MTPVLALLALATLATSQHIVGVPPEKQYLYNAAADGTWHCLSDPSIVLLADQINDNFCDCPDGSDEPGTNACEFTDDHHHYFYCANEGFFPRYIENFKVNDGVCDYDVCCDGSDEYLSGECENKCDEVKKQFDEFTTNKEAAVAKALEAKNDLVSKAAQAKLALVTQIAKLKEKLKADADELEKLNSDLENAQLSAEEPEKDQNLWQPLVDEFHEHVNDAEQQISGFFDSSKENLKKIKQLENMLADLMENYNPNFNDASVKKCVKSFAEYLSNKPEDTETPESGHIVKPLTEFGNSLASRLALFSPGEAGIAIVPTFGNVLHHYYEQMISSFKPVEISKKVVLENPISRLTLKSTEKIRKAIDALEKKINSQTAEVSIYQENLQRSYGAQDILRAVEGVWVTKKIGEYTYKLGFLDSIYQDNTLVGRFSSYDGKSLKFTQGSKCWNGPLRSAEVEMVCGPKHDLMSVSEPEKCQYKFILETPIACSLLSKDEIASSFKIDLSRL